MADLPDWTTSVDIIAQTIAELSVDIIAQTVGDIAIDIAAQTAGDITVDIAAQTVGNIDINLAASAITLDINIASQAADIDINLAASAITLDINIASQAADIDINIASQAGDVTISIQAQTIGITLEGDWQTEAGNDQNLSGGASIASGAGQYILDHTVPAGKKFYACQFSCVGYDGSVARKFRTSLECPAGIFVTHFGNDYGWGISYNRVIEATAGQHVKVYAFNLDTAMAAIYSTLAGYQVTA